MKLERGTHCRYQIRYHIVWKVKYSHRLLFGNRIAYLKKIIYEIGERYDYTVEAVGTDDNHVHVFIGAHPATAPAQLVQVLKSISARKMFKQYPEVKKFLWGGAFWAIGYYVRTVSDGPLSSIINKYVKDQNARLNKTTPTTKKPYQLRLVP